MKNTLERNVVYNECVCLQGDQLLPTSHVIIETGYGLLSLLINHSHIFGLYMHSFKSVKKTR